MLLWTGGTHSLSILFPLSWHAVHRMKQVLFNPVSCLGVLFIKAVDGHPLVVLFLSKISMPCEHPVAVWNQWIYLRNKSEWIYIAEWGVKISTLHLASYGFCKNHLPQNRFKVELFAAMRMVGIYLKAGKKCWFINSIIEWTSCFLFAVGLSRHWHSEF